MRPLLEGRRTGELGVVVEGKEDWMWERIGGRRKEAWRCASEPVATRAWFTISIGVGVCVSPWAVSGTIDASWAAILMVTGMVEVGTGLKCCEIREMEL